MDIISSTARSRNMAMIHAKDTKPEVYLRKLLFAAGFRYRKNDSRIIGHPDIYLPKYNTAIFVNGCFWHRHKGCQYAYFPKSNTQFWEKKFNDNISRDERVKRSLEQAGIKRIIVWECTIKKMKRSQQVEEEELKIIIKAIKDPDISELEC